MASKEVDGGKGLQGRYVAAARQHDIGLAAMVIAGPLPDPEPGLAVLDRLLHRQPLRRRLLAGDNEIDVVPAAQAMVGDRQQTIGVGRQIDADDLGFLVDDMVDETGVLMAEAVMILTPDMAGQQVIQRGDGPPPGNVMAYL